MGRRQTSDTYRYLLNMMKAEISIFEETNFDVIELAPFFRSVLPSPSTSVLQFGEIQNMQVLQKCKNCLHILKERERERERKIDDITINFSALRKLG